MKITQQFSAYVREVAQDQGREDLTLVERSWDQFAALYSRILEQVAPVLSLDPERRARPLAQWCQIAEVVAYDIAASKRLLDEGFLVQAPAMLRVAMELGATLTVLAWSNKLSQWLAGKPVSVEWKEKNRRRTKAIGECTYGQLASSLKFLVEHTRASQDSQLTVIVEDLSEVHERFRRTLNSNKYIHKSRELVNHTRWLLTQYLTQAQDGSKSVAVREGLLDMRFEFLVTFDRCLYQQATSRFYELCRQIECHAVGLPQSERDGFNALATELIAAGQQFEEALRPHWAAWATRHPEEAS